MRTIDELIKHMEQEKANNLFIVGPYVGDYELLTEEENNAFTLKGLVKQKEIFFKAHDKIVTPADELVKSLFSMKSLIHKLYLQTINPLVKPILDQSIETVFLKGNAMAFECSVCHKGYNYETVMLKEQYLCDCGRHIRPMCLLNKEKYDVSKIEAFDADLLKATTIFLIGFDFNELELCKQLEVIAAKKQSGFKMPVVVVVGECDKHAVYETFAPEFIVDEKPETALERFIEQMNQIK